MDQLLNTRSPTSALVAAISGGSDPRIASLVDRLRTEILRRDNEDWQPGDTEGYWGERRCCSAEALRWHRGIRVEVHRLQLAASLAEQYGGKPGYAPLRTSRAECLASAASAGKLLGSYGPIILRGGETARLTAGWTRARLHVKQNAGRAVDEDCSDVFAGLRVALSARASGGEAGTWELGVFTVTGELRSESTTLTTEHGWFGQDDDAEYRSDDAGTRFGVTREERCWLAVMSDRWERASTQVLLCASLVELD